MPPVSCVRPRVHTGRKTLPTALGSAPGNHRVGRRAPHQLSYLSAMLSQLTADVEGASFDVSEPAVVTLYIAGSALLLANLRAPEPGVTPSTPKPCDRLDGKVG